MRNSYFRSKRRGLPSGLDQTSTAMGRIRIFMERRHPLERDCDSIVCERVFAVNQKILVRLGVVVMAEKEKKKRSKGYVKRRNQIEAALINQLKNKGGDADQYVDLVRDYMRLWDVKNELLENIEERGAGYEEWNSKGLPVWKSNPSVKDCATINRQMLTLLKELGLSADNVGGGGGEL